MAEQQDLFGEPVVSTTARKGKSVPAPDNRPGQAAPIQSNVIPATRTVPFGKYKGEPYERLLADADYSLWFLNSAHARLQTQFPALLAFLIGRFGNPESTPEHNRLQNRFLTEAFAIRFAMAVNSQFRATLADLKAVDLGDAWERYARRELGREVERLEKRQRWDAPSKLPALKAMLLDQAEGIRFEQGTGTLDRLTWVDPVKVYDLEFERAGLDVVYRATLSGSVVAPAVSEYAQAAGEECNTVRSYGAEARLRVEVKPIVGDDYPTVLRAMKVVKASHLLVGEYCGAGATWDELVRVFALSGITAVRLADVETMEVPPALVGVRIQPLTSQDARDTVNKLYAEICPD